MLAADLNAKQNFIEVILHLPGTSSERARAVRLLRVNVCTVPQE